MSRTFSTSRIHREVIQAKGQRGSNQKSACGVVIPTQTSTVGQIIPVVENNNRVVARPADTSGPSLRLDDMMPDMPGTNLTRDEAQTRARLLAVDSYTVELDLTTSETTFASTTTIAFTCTEAGAETFADLVGATVHEITLNGSSLDPTEVYVDSRIRLSDLRERNELVVRADCPYSRTGEGLHRFVDPVDDRVYTYTQFEVPDARRVFTTFEQPDLKSVFTFHVTAAEDWKVVSNAPTPEPRRLGDGRAVGDSPPPEPMSTYITAVIAGEYHAELATYDGKFGQIPLGHYCRQSLVEHMDTDELLELTRWGFEFFEDAFDYPYPFHKYDQLY